MDSSETGSNRRRWTGSGEKLKHRAEDIKTLIAFKRLGAPYTPSRTNGGGPQLKFKFCATLSAAVAQVNRRRSVELRLLGNDGWQSCGNVTIPANQDIPKVGAVVEVRYLDAYRESNALCQSVFLEPRDDDEPVRLATACQWSGDVFKLLIQCE
ncbi:MAG: hypothetical protein ABSA45_11955 [Verrucomicrobiota bacterium]|jgi:bifunctional non-homologous end joining protein LigD